MLQNNLKIMSFMYSKHNHRSRYVGYYFDFSPLWEFMKCIITFVHIVYDIRREGSSLFQ